MGPSGRMQLIIGALATAAVAFLSYIVVKKRVIHDKNASVHQEGLKKEEADSGAPTASEKLVSEVTASQSSQAPQELQYQETQEKNDTGGGDTSIREDEKRADSLTDEGQNQTSFIVIDNGEEAVPPDNGQHPKKSDRSSDESSYDVVDDEQLVENVEQGEEIEESERDEGGHALDVGSEQKQSEQDTFLDSNESSMVIIEDLDQSGLSKSESSFYASADETVGLESRLEEIKEGEEAEKKSELQDVPEEDASVIAATGGADVSTSHEEYKVEDKQADEVPGHLDEPEESTSAGDPVTVSEVSLPVSQADQKTEDVSSRASVLLKSEPDTTQDTASVSEVELSAGDVTEVLTLCQNSPSTVSKENIRTLVDLLHKKIPELHSTVLNCLLRVAAFTQNVKTLRESGCSKVVANQILEICKTDPEELDAELLNSLCQVLTNLTLDPKSQAELESTVPPLVDLLISSEKESIKLSVLRPLINFSSQNNFHSHYTRAIQDLYTLVDTGSHIAKVQSLKVLVNLSLNENMVPHMLAAKAPVTLLELLDLPKPTDLILRTLTVLANIKMAIHKGNVSLASLPVEDKAASPETMYMALHGVDRIHLLRSKVFRLTRHADEDVSHQASKLYQYLQETS